MIFREGLPQSNGTRRGTRAYWTRAAARCGSCRATAGRQAVHERFCSSLQHNLLVLDARRPRAVRVQRAGTAREIVEEAHRRRPYLFRRPRLRRARGATSAAAAGSERWRTTGRNPMFESLMLDMLDSRS